jgi:spermidine synthase
MSPSEKPEAETRVRTGNALGVFFVALATLMLEITLTRIFSVTIWYHFGSLAISLAMFGVGASGVLVYLAPGLFAPERMQRQLPVFCTLFAISIAFCFFLQLGIAFVPRFSMASLGSLTLLYLVTAVPFFLSGLCIALIFTHRPLQIGRLYFADLVGAGLGCVTAVGAMFLLSAPDVVLLAAVLAAIGSVCFGAVGGRVRGPVVACLGLVALFGFNLKTNALRIDFVKGKVYAKQDFEDWNPYAYVGVGEITREKRPFGWGLSSVWEGTAPAERAVKIDAGAATTISEFSGDLAVVEHLQHDVTSIGHYLLDGHKVLVIGAGGGRDILAAKALGADTIHALEYNASVVKAVEEVFADFSGMPYSLPGVTKIVDEGRSYTRRTSESYDIIQASLVDSWAANASGAYVMAENFLYTKEAFTTFYEHLTDRGILSISRFNFARTPQLLRSASLAMAVLNDMGIENAGDHLVIVTARRGNVGTLLMSKQPFESSQVETLRREAARLAFEVRWAPGAELKNEIAELLTTSDPQAFIDAHMFDITAPTDNKPFFFHMMSTSKAWKELTSGREEGGQVAGFAVKWYGNFVLLGVLAIATILAVVCILLPLFAFKRSALEGVKDKHALLGYFTCLGVGFMLVEIPMMQRFTLFLGHPVYALAVVLFSILLFAGVGSLITSRMQAASAETYLKRVLVGLLGVVALYVFVVPKLLDMFIVQEAPVRMVIAVVALMPLGLILGMPLPLGMRIVQRRASQLIPWMWGVNGACSVFASLFAIYMAMNIGLRNTVLYGAAVYAIALLLVASLRTTPNDEATGT